MEICKCKLNIRRVRLVYTWLANQYRGQFFFGFSVTTQDCGRWWRICPVLGVLFPRIRNLQPPHRKRLVMTSRSTRVLTAWPPCVSVARLLVQAGLVPSQYCCHRAGKGLFPVHPRLSWNMKDDVGRSELHRLLPRQAAHRPAQFSNAVAHELLRMEQEEKGTVRLAEFA